MIGDRASRLIGADKKICFTALLFSVLVGQVLILFHGKYIEACHLVLY